MLCKYYITVTGNTLYIIGEPAEQSETLTGGTIENRGCLLVSERSERDSIRGG